MCQSAPASVRHPLKGRLSCLSAYTSADAASTFHPCSGHVIDRGRLITIGPRASAERRVELDLGGVTGGRGPETFDFRPIGPLTSPQKPTPQDPLRSALTRGPIVASACAV